MNKLLECDSNVPLLNDPVTFDQIPRLPKVPAGWSGIWRGAIPTGVGCADETAHKDDRWRIY